ncbi:uncharacterized protein CCOS01_17101 [Colletotrichum costaricense]|uniref:Uncharacterized protein n=1 Tax=Colletotrichum costaricense TaxID=1209916 RepID=A0AAJ0DRR4_9PEZI|nr:uncharacterized protein CCOS01_17101 [Colletotrichum costaricense]KAK1503112.1 hypothetical protein CCOS01_17101 [Colletotrichum costaricense]
MPPKASNIERQAWNSKCRNLLAKHIFDERLGVIVEDSKVRLKTTEDDLYAWDCRLAIAPLFEKNLSTHSVGVYKKICAGIGTLFQAVPARVDDAEDESQVLAAENQCLRTQVQEILRDTDQLRCSLQEMDDWARREKQAKADTEAKLEAANIECEGLRNQLKETEKQLELLEAMVSRHRSAFAQILNVTEGIVDGSSAFPS